MSLLIDADYIVYKCCASCEDEIDFGEDVILVTSKFSEAFDMVSRELYSIAECLGSFDDSILFFSDTQNFRKIVKPDYKGHRNRKKPCGYRRVINKLKESFPVISYPNLEADDAMGIWATADPGAHIIVSPDKDMKQIPGLLFDMKDAVQEITPEEALEWHYIQTMAGDQTDGYSGVPGLGVKRSKVLLDKEGLSWKTVVGAFHAKGLTEQDALQNATLAKILHAENYDVSTGQIKFWTPPPATSTRTNNRAGVQLSSDRTAATKG